MKTTMITLLAAAALSAPAFAATEADVNADGVLTIDEVQAAFPEVTAEAFSAMDVNADGALDSDEIVAAQSAGLIPPQGERQPQHSGSPSSGCCTNVSISVHYAGK